MTDLLNDAGELHFPALFRFVRTATASYYSAFVIAALCSAVTIPVLLRKLGAENFGIYTLAISLATLVQLPFSGLETGGTQIVSSASPREQFGVVRSLLRAGIPRALGASAALCLLCVVTFYAVPPSLVPRGLRASYPDLARAFAIACLGIPARCGGNLAEGICVGLFRFRTVSVINAASNLLQAGGVVAIALAGGGIFAILQFWTLLGILTFATQTGVVLLVARGHEYDPVPAGPVLRNLVRQTGWLGLEAAVNGVAGKSDEIIISLWASAAAVGYYSIAFRIPSILLLMISQYASVYVPIVASAERSAGGAAKKILILANRHILIVFLPVAVALGIWARPLLNLWLGAHGASIVPLLRIALLSTVVVGTHQLTYALLCGLNRARVSALIACWQMLLRIAVALVLVHRFGATGVALAVVASAVIGDSILRTRALLKVLGANAAFWLKHVVLVAAGASAVLVGGFLWVRAQTMWTTQLLVAVLTLVVFAWMMWATRLRAPVENTTAGAQQATVR